MPCIGRDSCTRVVYSLESTFQHFCLRFHVSILTYFKISIPSVSRIYQNLRTLIYFSLFIHIYNKYFIFDSYFYHIFVFIVKT